MTWHEWVNEWLTTWTENEDGMHEWMHWNDMQWHEMWCNVVAWNQMKWKLNQIIWN